jgi:predicted GIY-YIG superfamily endonuclease
MKRFVHSVVVDDVDLERAVALGSKVTATCGKTWVPELLGDELKGLPDCPECQRIDQPARRTGKVRLKDSARQPHYVYRCYDSTDRLIYVGCTVNPVSRLREHRKNTWWAGQIARTRLIVFPDRTHALAKEREAIATEQPRWNVKGKWNYRHNWSERDYVDYLTAIREGSAVTGTYSSKHLARVRAELDALTEGRMSA